MAEKGKNTKGKNGKQSTKQDGLQSLDGVKFTNPLEGGDGGARGEWFSDSWTPPC